MDKPTLQTLQAEITRLNKIIRGQIERDEQPMERNNLDNDTFQSTSMLEEQLRNLTAELEAALRKNEAISQELRLAYSVYQYIHEAMMVTDAENRIVNINPAFTRLTGYSLEEVVQRTPQFLSSGHHDKKFYQDMWLRLQNERHWEGEIQNRKKSGEVYIEWLSISAVHDANGSLQNYVALFSDITAEKKAAEQMWNLANYDTLTKLPNRRLFTDRLEQAMRDANRSGHSCALLFIDLDHFKEVNDSLGHQAGDVLLVQAAERMNKQLRSNDTVARMGGDEFTAILSGIQNESAVRLVAEHVLEVLAQPFYIFENTVRISASIGAAIYPQDGITATELIQHADNAMYISKKNGRNQVTLHAVSAT